MEVVCLSRILHHLCIRVLLLGMLKHCFNFINKPISSAEWEIALVLLSLARHEEWATNIGILRDPYHRKQLFVAETTETSV